MEKYKLDRYRYGKDKPPMFQFFYRKAQSSTVLRPIYKFIFQVLRMRRCIDLSDEVQIEGGLYFGHAYAITITPQAIIGKNVNIHKGVTIGRENRGKRKGTPIIGNNVWIGINSTIVGKVIIGDDVLIAPNAYINFDVPSHSVVYGNPGIIKHRDNATEGYINNCV